ncbi:MAG TPA: OsmC family protein [Bacteroidales bacterium]|nr:OsmC family protein [Bacteroidales bacterium]HRZ20960.1 OsmC family protein [Bacteroidales bacterium]
MSTKVRIKWNGKMAFDADVNGFAIRMDAAPEAGDKDQGPRPKPLTLAALGGCTGMDVVSLLEKMRVPLESFDMKIEAEQTDEHPRVYKKIHIVYIFKGKNLPLEKLQKAVELSQEKYCGVSAMLRKSAAVTYEIEVLSE